MKYGLLGEKLKHSFSPQIHNAFGIDDYILKEVPREEIDAFMKAKDFTAKSALYLPKEAQPKMPPIKSLWANFVYWFIYNSRTAYAIGVMLLILIACAVCFAVKYKRKKKR